MADIFYRCDRWALLLALFCSSCSTIVAQSPPSMAQLLTERTAQNPGDASAWRLLGRYHLENGDLQSALRACQTAVQLQPNNVSAHFDLGRVMLALKDLAQARYHFVQAASIAPQSDYGVQAVSYLQRVGELENDSSVVPPQFDLEPNRFGGTSFQADWPAGRPWFSATVDSGIMYNSNIELAPISRDPVTRGLGSAQGFFAPRFELNWLETERWSLGSNFSGYFTVNQSNRREFDLQDYQPGVFVERRWLDSACDVVARVQYVFALNEFAGSTFGNRHSITTSLARLQSARHTMVYWTIDHSNFADDGLFPDVSSLDGWTNTLGVLHDWFPAAGWFSALGGGVDVQLAELQGSDYAYDGVYAFLDADTVLPLEFGLNLQLGAGYRNYPEFAGDPSRNETLWRAGAQLSRDFSPAWGASLFATYDRFASANELFDAQRFFGGVMITYRFQRLRR